MQFWRKISVAALLACVSFGAQAAAVDPLIEGAKLCTRHLPRSERENGIPTHLLSAIASTESGRYHEGLGIKVPWPWTINAEGKGYFFDTKEQAMAAARKLRARGVQSMDVGCMQVNLYHHPNAFVTLDQAFDPQYNIAYAANFLKGLYQESNSWKTAASSYHSKTPVLGKKYVGIVYDNWYQIIDKLRQARSHVGATKVVVKNEPAKIISAPAVKTAEKQVAALPEQRGKKLAAFESPHMNSIKVRTKEIARENGVIIVTPAVKVVDATRPPEAKILRVSDNRLLSTKKTGPTFIFND